MNVMKSLWASVELEPVLMRRINGWLTVVWFFMLPVAVAVDWIYSVVFVSLVSIYANFTGHLASWQACRVEVRQEQIHEEQS